MSTKIDKIQFHVTGIPNSETLQLLATDASNTDSVNGVVVLNGQYPFVAFEVKVSGGTQAIDDFDVELQMFPGGDFHIFDNWNPDPPVVNTVANGASAAVAIRVGPAYAIQFKAANAVAADAAAVVAVRGVAAEEG